MTSLLVLLIKNALVEGKTKFNLNVIVNIKNNK